MRKGVAMTIACITSLLSINPAYAGETEMELNSQDSFIADMQAGLEERWSYDEDEDTMTNAEFVEYRKSLVDAEYSKLSKYSDVTFKAEKFDLLAHAYIEGLQIQQNALAYYTELNDLYIEMWGDGYNIRAYVIPEMIDHYGLSVPEEEVESFRKAKDSFGGDYTITTTTTTTTPYDANDVILADNEITVFDQEGIKVVVTGMEEPTLFSTKIQMRIENLNHHDIVVMTKDNQVVINGIMVNSPLYEDVKSGKTANLFMEFYNDTTLAEAGIDKINELAFTISVSDSNYYPLYMGEEVHLLIDDTYNIKTKEVYSDKETIRQVQELLNSAGYDCGSADGVPGKRTNSAILKFERDHGMEENTDITPDLLSKLQQSISG